MADTVNEQPQQPGSNRLPIILTAIKVTYGHYKKSRAEAFNHAVDLGVHLTEAKEIVGHGRWGQWVTKNCPFTDRTALIYMKVAEGMAAGFKYKKFSDLGIAAYVEAYADDLAKKKLRRSGAWGPRQRTGTKAPRTRRKRPSARFKNRKRGPYDDGTIPPLKTGQVFRVEWYPTRRGESCVVYVWKDVYYFHAIFLRYKLNLPGVRTAGEHETNNRSYESRRELTERMAHWAAEGFDGKSWPIAPQFASEPEVWDADPVTLQVLEEWQRSIEIAKQEMTFARRVQRGTSTPTRTEKEPASDK